MLTRGAIVVFFCLSFAATAFTQTPVVPRRLTKDVMDDKSQKVTAVDKVTVSYEGLSFGSILKADEYLLATLSRVYTSGDGEKLNGLAIEILNTLACKPTFFVLPHGIECKGQNGQTSAQRKFDFMHDYVFLSWAATDISGKRVVYRIGVHEGFSDPYNVTLPGITSPPLTGDDSDSTNSRVYDVFLGASPASEHGSLYLFTQQTNPAEAAIPAFVEKATGPLFISASKFLPLVDQTNAFLAVKPLAVEKTGPTFSKTVTVQVGVLRPPIARAKVKVTDFVKQPVPVSEFEVQAGDLVAKLKFVDARQFVCVKKLADHDGSSMVEVANRAGGNCTKDGATAESCRGEFANAFDRNLAAIARSCGKADVEEEVLKENEARPAGDRLNKEQIDAEVKKRIEAQPKVIEQVDTEVRKFILSQQPERITGDVTFANTPLVHWNFGILSSFALSASLSKPRVKVGNDGKLAADPLSRPMTLFVVNIAPRGFDPEARPMMLSERLRPFAGVVATPDFGLGGGLSIGIWKGLGFNIGGAVLFVPTPNGTDEIGSAPSDPTAPFAVAHAKAFFVGASYSFPGK
jgi:hypothetical protein